MDTPTTVPESAEWRLDYSGALYGYYRMEPVETEQGARLGPVRQFFEDRGGRRDTLLLGMGDNFSPEFGASIQPENRETDCVLSPNVELSGKPLPFPQALYKDKDRTLEKGHIRPVSCDNVANFLIHAGYRAIVPGREDFLYGADWLRSIAIGLQNAKGTPGANDPNDPLAPTNPNDDHRLNLLAANLRFFPKSKDKPASAGVPCQLLFARASTNGASECIEGDLPATSALDWLERIEASLDSETGVEDRVERETSLHAEPQPADHAAGILQLRRTLMENQARQVLSMTAAFDEVSPCIVQIRQIRDALKTLALEKSYLIDGTRPSSGPTLTGLTKTSVPKALADLRSAVSQLPRSPSQPASQAQDGSPCFTGKPSAPLQDFVAIAKELLAKFESIDSEPRLLLSARGREAGRRLLLRAIAREQREIGYTLYGPKRQGEQTSSSRTLIVGIVGQKILDAVSPTNLELGRPPSSQPGMAPPTALPAVAATSGASPSRAATGANPRPVKGEVKALDPLRTLVSVLRGARQMSLDDPANSFDHIVIMAQMTRGEAEDLGSQLRWLLHQHAGSDPSFPDLCRIPAVILSQAQDDEHSPDVSLNYSTCDTAPVLTPYPPYVSPRSGALRRPWSAATLEPAVSPASSKVTLANLPPPEPAEDRQEDTARTNLYLLLQEMSAVNIPRPVSCNPALNHPGDVAMSFQPDCENDLTAQLLAALRRREDTVLTGDVVLLEQRDIFYGEMPEEYQDYSVCNTPAGEPPADGNCRLRVALDRVLWKGDYQQRVMVAGSDLTSMLALSRQQGQLDKTLSFADAFGQSLATFGVAQPESLNLSDPGSVGGQYPIPEDGACGKATGSTVDPASFCVNGQPIQADASYWVITSDHLAHDKVTYKALVAHEKDSYQDTPNTLDFLTASIAAGLLRRPPARNVVPAAGPSEWSQQQRHLIRLDVGKVVAGFTAREPQGGNPSAQNFQGSTDARASTPTQQELDLETLARFSLDLPVRPYPFIPDQQLTTSIGLQEDSEYDRTATGNLTDKPTTLVDALNNFTIGPFVQMRVPQWPGLRRTRWIDSGRALPRTLLVFSPFQYSRQLTGTFLFFPFTVTPPPPALAGEYTFHAPVVSSLFQKVGLRHEDAKKEHLRLEKGSYIEAGYEIGVQRDVLSSLSLRTPDAALAKPLTCDALSTVTIAACFAGYANSKSSTYKPGFTLDASTLATGLTVETLHTQGVYWDIHLQEKFPRLRKPKNEADTVPAAPGKSDINTAVTLTFDSKADWFSPRSALHSLNTQTHYDIPLSLAINFPMFRNFSLSPTLSAFRYGSQITGQRIQINTFSIEAKWYFFRDSSVPAGRQLRFVGPASSDQTATAKLK